MAPLSQADIDSFFHRASSGTPAGSSQPRARRSSPPTGSIALDDSDDEIVCLSSPVPPRPAPHPIRAPRPSTSITSHSQPRRRPSSQHHSPEQDVDNDDIRNIRLSPERKAWRATSRRVISDDDDESEIQPTSSRWKRKAAISFGSNAPPQQQPRLNAASSTRSHGNANATAYASGSDASASHLQLRKPRETPAKRRLRRMRAARLNQPMSSSEDFDVGDSDSFIDSDRPPDRTPCGRRKSGPSSSIKRARRHADPDDDTDVRAGTEEEGADAIEQDEPESFVTSTRLRERGETEHQRLLRKLKAKRLNLPSSSSDHEEDAEEDAAAATYDSEVSFITDDDEDFDESLMPNEFSLGYAQSQEYKFKVMFQYLLLLVIQGPGVLPLKGPQREYMAPVAELREYVKGIRNLWVRSQIWRAEFVRALETYPAFISVYLTGKLYDHDSHAIEPVSRESSDNYDDDDGDDEDKDDDEDEDEDDEDEALPRSFHMGPHCLDSARLFHSLSHWEHALFHRIKRWYRELLRAQHVDEGHSESGGEGSDSDDFGISTPPRIRQLRGTSLPDVRDVNAVLEWMETQDYQNAAFETFTCLEQAARKLGGDDTWRETDPDHQ